MKVMCQGHMIQFSSKTKTGHKSTIKVFKYDRIKESNMVCKRDSYSLKDIGIIIIVKPNLRSMSAPKIISYQHDSLKLYKTCALLVIYC